MLMFDTGAGKEKKPRSMVSATLAKPCCISWHGSMSC